MCEIQRGMSILNKIITAEKAAESAEQMNALTGIIIGAAIEVHRFLGPGLLESAYEACLAFELKERGLKIERQVELPLCYKEMHLDCGARLARKRGCDHRSQARQHNSPDSSCSTYILPQTFWLQSGIVD